MGGMPRGPGQCLPARPAPGGPLRHGGPREADGPPEPQPRHRQGRSMSTKVSRAQYASSLALQPSQTSKSGRSIDLKRCPRSGHMSQPSQVMPGWTATSSAVSAAASVLPPVAGFFWAPSGGADLGRPAGISSSEEHSISADAWVGSQVGGGWLPAWRASRAASLALARASPFAALASSLARQAARFSASFASFLAALRASASSAWAAAHSGAQTVTRTTGRAWRKSSSTSVSEASVTMSPSTSVYFSLVLVPSGRS
mmetsp:Transcript_15502/g.39830  ORF Transcript_15502/g.39830 Transcript_15502/m.39830 type:complete len:257 (+) Transcript_15502:1505-2275(+)